MNEEDDFINTIAVPGGPMHIAFQYLKKSGKTTAVVSYLIIPYINEVKFIRLWVMNRNGIGFSWPLCNLHPAWL